MDSRVIYIIILLSLSAFFSATETAYSSMSKLKMKHLSNVGNNKASKVLKLQESYTKLISSILIGNNIVNILRHFVYTGLY